jgi:serine/threonine-protein kinase
MEESISQAPSLPIQLVGQRIGSYRIIEPLGSGGMSTVFLAVHPETGHEVALKVLLGAFSRNSTLLQRFLREARSVETLEHPNIVAIYDRGVDQGRHYIVLEYVPGGDFHEYVQRNGPLGVTDALAVIRGVASGLRYAAGRSLIHRDIKPSNVLRTPTGEPKIIDLGLALQSEFEDERVTREGTTVGTVDYMAPEQARDSRATSIQSDMYSLGCTFYYLLAGVPPYPGGDITEKLTRHARAPAPDIRDLRPDIPAAVAAILLRMMAKQPGDRFPDYDALIAALDAARSGDGDTGGAIPLVPLEGEEPGNWPRSYEVAGARQTAGAGNATVDHDEAALSPLEPFGGLSLELVGEREPGGPSSAAIGGEALLPRMGRIEPTDDSLGPTGGDDAEVQPAPRGHRSLVPWALATAAVATLAVVVVIGVHLIPGQPRVPDSTRDGMSVLDRVPGGLVVETRPSSKTEPHLAPPSGKGHLVTPIVVAAPVANVRSSEREWHEPDDTDPVPSDPDPRQAATEELRRELPEWTRTPTPTRPEDSVVVVRRVSDQADGPTTEPTLHHALDRHIGGIVELADNGPLTVDDLRISGESRTIRARRGYRPTIRIMPSKTEAAMEQSAFAPLHRKSLTLEGVDLIVDPSDLSGRQRALFGCSGGNLTLRDCTITVINPKGMRFTLVREEPAPSRPQETAPRASRIWLERTLVRGTSVTLAELGGGSADLVLNGSAILVGGVGPKEIVRVDRRDGGGEQRVFFAGALVACPGPIIACEQPEGAAARGKPLAIRAYDSAFGRLQGPGIASIVTVSYGGAAAERGVDWAGDRNVFAGWKGFFARGKDLTITVDGLAQVRSTWSATEQGSQEILTAWPISTDPSRLLPTATKPFLSGGRLALTDWPPRPGPGLFPKTIDAYPDPMIPEVSAWAIAQPNRSLGAGPRPNKLMALDAELARRGRSDGAGMIPSAVAPPDMTMNTAEPGWAGDLGAFLRRNVRPETRHVRVRVVGTGSHRFTPVRLPEGITLEIQVEAAPGAELPSWSPDPQATGPGMIELRGGALVLSNVILRHDPASKLESLLALEDAHLILHRCQVTVLPDSGATAGDLIVFRAPTTRPMSDHPGNAVFRAPVDRPVCRMIDTVLIGHRAAIRAELGRGLVALSNCAVASDEIAVALDPSKVARRAFEADLWLDRCTLAAARSILGLGPWRGLAPGPDRPWLISSKQCAFLTLSEARTREAALLRVDAEAFAGGSLFCQSDGDAYEVDRTVAAGEGQAEPAGPREARTQWEQFWGSNHLSRPVTVPRGPSFRLLERPRPGRLEPPDLILDPQFHPQRPQLDVGADLRILSIAPRPFRPGAHRN